MTPRVREGKCTGVTKVPEEVIFPGSAECDSIRRFPAGAADSTAVDLSMFAK
jgi:hypothetical protein